MKPLSGLDALFLHLETPATPMHVGAVHLLQLPKGHRGDFVDDVKRHVARRLPLSPVFTRQLAEMPLNFANPVWVRADEVDLDRHIINYHHTAIAITGGYENWEKMVAEVRASGDDFAFLSPWEPVENPMLCFCYVDTRKRLGHYTEFMWWHPSMVGVIPMIPNLDA